MGTPLIFSSLFLLAASLAVAADPKPTGRLTSGCVDRSVSPEFCGWTVRYEGKGEGTRARSVDKTVEQKAVEAVLGEYAPVQPAQIQGRRAAILVERKPGDFAVVSLEKKDGMWSIISVGEPTRALR